ncbi:flagellar motor switch protein FliN/FliY [Desulfacinum hydrothermale DSM 13146]|uniref:Flagellar motor switch protein FliN n=1 Tax=Desulfacinum hydrothermale DSM 13146 TaxID=1121390 RepID=A0A1W1X615_9BACT|nr:flagellar motor switch protein FliN [Desulfacinum hydrothermale]SMC19344.1 flagellar motor switch protein FliN/FliY [Desulfacinum hydrothermale DSM 13146]
MTKEAKGNMATELEPMQAPNVSAPSADTGHPSAEEDAEAALKREMRDLDFILDLPLEIAVELGRTKLLINDLLQLGQGSVVELNKFAGEPLEILVNNKLIARGEAVVVNEKFGVRITDIVSPMERVKQLG